MVNKYRGEIAAQLDGAAYTLCLTLGALAELESAFGSDDMLSLATRFSGGRISARDCVRIIGAGLRGAGHEVADDTVSQMRGDDGAAGYVDIVARLLAATFGGPVAVAADVAVSLTKSPAAKMAKAEVHEPQALPRPFLGPR
jgi:Phage tail tube protein, GTA-gp10